MADHEPPSLKDAGTRVKRAAAPRKCAAYRQRAGAEEMRSLPLYRSGTRPRGPPSSVRLLVGCFRCPKAIAVLACDSVE